MITFLKLEEQHQHSNGGGWVANSAKVENSVYVGINAQVHGNARVYGNARVFDNAWVFDNTWVFDNAWVYGNARVYGHARVYGYARVSGDARVYGDAWVYGNARVYGNAWVYGDAWVLNPLTITGSAHSVSLVSYTQIAIGCHVRDFADWLKNYKTVGKENGYTTEQIKEYGEILRYLVKAAKVYVKRNQAALKGK